MFRKIRLYYYTVKHLKPVQIRYRIWYAVRNKFKKLIDYTYSSPGQLNINHLKFQKGFAKQPSVKNGSFTFINQSKTFPDSINWNYTEYGKLWAYHLNYFDYLFQGGISREQGLHLITEFISHMPDNRIGMEPYPTSLRTINWIRFISKYQIYDSQINDSLYIQYQMLLDNIEYHILGNHLIENGCSLVFGAFYFEDYNLWEKGKEILLYELEEQILNDGGHYEKSSMYHCIVLERLLDVYNLLLNNSCFGEQEKLKQKIMLKLQTMLGWLKGVKWENGDIPEVNDHVPEMLPPITGIENYAHRLGLNSKEIELSDSGYRKFQGKNFELLVDAGDIGPDYVLGHAHSDIFSFLLQVDGKEIISDTGTSTYENNARRNKERSTSAHNTVMVEGKEQNEVWSAFRVGRRGKVTLQKDEKDEIIASHDSYRFLGVTHRRRFSLDDEEIIIQDYLISNSSDVSAKLYIHFHPDIDIEQSDNCIRGKLFTILFSEYKSIEISEYEKAAGYNFRKTGLKVVVSFRNKLFTKIIMTDNK